MSYILYLRHNNGVRSMASHWKTSRTSLRDDAVCICSVINEVMESEISWPSLVERQHLRNRIPQLPGCIGYVDGTLYKIRRPNCEENRAYFNGRKKVCFVLAVLLL